METVAAGFLYTTAAFRDPKGGAAEERLVLNKMAIVSFMVFIFY
jgi:hypothetical protein